MSLPTFDSQIELFGLQLQRDKLFKAEDRYRLFAEKVYPVLMRVRERLEGCYCVDNGRPAKEPVVVLGVSLLQFMERLPDRQAVEHLKYHVGWKYALGQELDEAVFDSTVLVRFRQRLLESGVMRQDGDAVVFVKDHLFGSPSMAAMALLGRTSNGWREWKSKDGATLDELKRTAIETEP